MKNKSLKEISLPFFMQENNSTLLNFLFNFLQSFRCVFLCFVVKTKNHHYWQHSQSEERRASGKWWNGEMKEKCRKEMRNKSLGKAWWSMKNHLPAERTFESVNNLVLCSFPAAPSPAVPFSSFPQPSIQDIFCFFSYFFHFSHSVELKML